MVSRVLAAGTNCRSQPGPMIPLFVPATPSDDPFAGLRRTPCNSKDTSRMQLANFTSGHLASDGRPYRPELLRLSIVQSRFPGHRKCRLLCYHRHSSRGIIITCCSWEPLGLGSQRRPRSSGQHPGLAQERSCMHRRAWPRSNQVSMVMIKATRKEHDIEICESVIT